VRFGIASSLDFGASKETGKKRDVGRLCGKGGGQKKKANATESGQGANREVGRGAKGQKKNPPNEGKNRDYPNMTKAGFEGGTLGDDKR